jgi:hypothetical protein
MPTGPVDASPPELFEPEPEALEPEPELPEPDDPELEPEEDPLLDEVLSGALEEPPQAAARTARSKMLREG